MQTLRTLKWHVITFEFGTCCKANLLLGIIALDGHHYEQYVGHERQEYDGHVQRYQHRLRLEQDVQLRAEGQGAAEVHARVQNVQHCRIHCALVFLGMVHLQLIGTLSLRN